MDWTVVWASVTGLICAIIGVLLRQFFVWLSSKNIVKDEALKEKLLEQIRNLAEIGIAVANQEYVDLLRERGLWKTLDNSYYEENKAKALQIATDSIEGLLTKTERSMIEKTFGNDSIEEVIRPIVLQSLRQSKEVKKEINEEEVQQHGN